jgi:hypothetical protein
LILEHQEEWTDLKTLTIEFFEGLRRSNILTEPSPKPAAIIQPEWWSELRLVKQLFDRVLMSSTHLSRREFHTLMSREFPPTSSKPVLCCQSVTLPDSARLLGSLFGNPLNAVTIANFPGRS